MTIEIMSLASASASAVIRTCNFQPQRIAESENACLSFHPREKQAFGPEHGLSSSRENFTTTVHELKYIRE
jgi:hypothetical protein